MRNAPSNPEAQEERTLLRGLPPGILQSPDRFAAEVERSVLAESLEEFVRAAWPLVEPSTNYVDGWHISLICEYLSAVYPEQRIRDLIITIPPRCMKSLLVSVFWPTWAWIQHPESRWIFSSYAAGLAVRDATRARRVMESVWFRERFGSGFKLTSDQNQKMRFENDRTGYRIATSVGGSVTGEGGDILCADDPQNVQDIYSKASRDMAGTWWNEVFSTRRNDPATSGRVIVMQRAHQDDLVGRLAGKGYEVVNLPMESNVTKIVTFPLSGRIVNRAAGDLLWPKRFNREAVEALKTDLGSRGASAQLQQEPVPEGGTIVNRAWWRWMREFPATFKRVIHSWDTAFKVNQTDDYSVCTIWGEDERGAWLIHGWRERVEFPELKRQAKALAERYPAREYLIEDKASGQSLIQEFQRDTRLPIIPVKVDADKVSRAHAVSSFIEAGRVFLREGDPFAALLVDEFSAFPSGSHDDIVDSSTQAFFRIFHNSRLTPSVRVL